MCLGGASPLSLITLSCSLGLSGSQGTGQLEWKASTDVRTRGGSERWGGEVGAGPMAGMIQSTGQTLGGLALGTYEE